MNDIERETQLEQLEEGLHRERTNLADCIESLLAVMAELGTLTRLTRNEVPKER